VKTKDIQILVGKMQVLKFHSPVCENVKYLINDFELDVISYSKSGMLYEFEVKISRGDFKADLKKRKHKFYSQLPERGPNYFSYVCPKDLIKQSEVGTGVGLYYIDNDEVIEIQAPKRLHKIIHDKVKILEKICRVNSERQFLGSCRLTFENKDNIAKKAKYFKPVIGGPDKFIENKNQIVMNKELEKTVFPSEEKTVSVMDCTEYGGAHNYTIKNCLGFNDGKTQYDTTEQIIQFVHKANDGKITPGVQSEQLVIALIDRHEKLNARFPSPQNEKMLAGLKMFLDACQERVQERIDRGVMGNLQK
jgi:hypothetical protein